MANAPYAEGVKPYLPLLPLITDRHVDAFTLAGTKEEVTAHIIALRQAGIDSIIIRPLAARGRAGRPDHQGDGRNLAHRPRRRRLTGIAHGIRSSSSG